MFVDPLVTLDWVKLDSCCVIKRTWPPPFPFGCGTFDETQICAPFVHRARGSPSICHRAFFVRTLSLQHSLLEHRARVGPRRQLDAESRMPGGLWWWWWSNAGHGQGPPLVSSLPRLVACERHRACVLHCERRSVETKKRGGCFMSGGCLAEGLVSTGWLSVHRMARNLHAKANDLHVKVSNQNTQKLRC
jgi:hypothetical protein